MEGKVIILSAPSGAGKTTLARSLLQRNNDLDFSISASTRHKRGKLEKHGKDYYFLSSEAFKKKIEQNEFVEWEEVYEGKYYGTLQSEVQRIWDSDKNILFDVDVQGAVNLKNYFGDKALSIFIQPTSMETLKQRLIDRGTETADSLATRLAKIKYEMTFKDKFDAVLINDCLDEAIKKVQQMYHDFKLA